VSVLVPCYNKAEYLDATLDSVYAQTLQDHELIVVDDGSTDGSVERLRAHEGRAQVIYGPNRGASAARALALQHARGRFIQYLDADDLLLPHALATRVEALERTGADVAYTDYQRFSGSPEPESQRGARVTSRIEDVSPDAEIACFTSFWRPPAALLYTRAITERIAWNPELPVIQDARYLLDAALAGARFVHVPGVSALYRDDLSTSLSRRSRPAFARDVVHNADEVAAIWRARGPLSEPQLQAVAECYDYAARETFATAPDAFAHCVQRLRELDRLRPLSWPRLAATLRHWLGPRHASRALAWLGRPAQ
jgi:glycosyltransferase involved in cell wall biosynthesis